MENIFPINSTGKVVIQKRRTTSRAVLEPDRQPVRVPIVVRKLVGHRLGRAGGLNALSAAWWEWFSGPESGTLLMKGLALYLKEQVLVMLQFTLI